MNAVIFFLFTLLLTVPMAAVEAQFLKHTLRTTVDLQSLKPAIGELFAVPGELQQLIDSGRVLILVKVGGDSLLLAFQESKFVDTTAADSSKTPDFTIQTTPSAFLSLMNSEDKELTLKGLIAQGNLVITASDPARQAAIKAALSSGAMQFTPLSNGSKVIINGVQRELKPFQGNLFRARVEGEDLVVNRLGGVVGALTPRHDFYSTPPRSVPVYFNRPPGILAQSPGLIYDNTTRSPNVMGPHNVFKVNPGLIGPNDILRLNPGLVGPADMALLNPGLRGPAEFAYVMGIGAHSNTAKHLAQNNLLPRSVQERLGNANRWGNRR